MITVKILMWIFTAICWWKIFEKAGIKGWKAIIPFYGDYVRFDMADKKWWYFPFLLLSLAESIVGWIYSSLYAIEIADSMIDMINIDSDLTFFFWASMFLSILVFAMSVYVGIIIAAKFGKNKVFGAGLGIIPIVFAPIIAFDKSVVYLDKNEI